MVSAIERFHCNHHNLRCFGVKVEKMNPIFFKFPIDVSKIHFETSIESSILHFEVSGRSFKAIRACMNRFHYNGFKIC